MGNFLANPQGQNSYTGESFPLNPTHFASPQGEAFALSQLQRLFGISPQVYNVAPTAGPYSWAPSREVMPETFALDGTPLGGVNLGAVANMYQNNPQAAADQMLQQELSPKVQNFAQQGQAAPVAASAGAQPFAAPAQQNSSTQSVGGATLPLSFYGDLTGQKMGGGGAAPQGVKPPVPQGSAFATAGAQPAGAGMAQLMQIVQWLQQQGVKL